jgi:hypothetical protein
MGSGHLVGGLVPIVAYEDTAPLVKRPRRDEPGETRALTRAQRDAPGAPTVEARHPEQGRCVFRQFTPDQHSYGRISRRRYVRPAA